METRAYGLIHTEEKDMKQKQIKNIDQLCSLFVRLSLSMSTVGPTRMVLYS